MGLSQIFGGDGIAGDFGGLKKPPQLSGFVTRGQLAVATTVYQYAIPPTSAPGTGTGALGTIVFGANPNAGEYITLNGQDWTFVAGAPVGPQTQIQGTTALTVAQLASDLEASGDGDITPATYTAFAAALVIVHDTLGVLGNSYSMDDDGIINVTRSGDWLFGGEGNAPAFVLVCSIDSGADLMFAKPVLNSETNLYAELSPVTGVQSDGVVLNVAGCTHMNLATPGTNWDFTISSLDNRSIEMIGPMVIRTDATREQLSTTAETVVIPNDSSGKLPAHVLVGMETAAALLCKPAATGDTTAAADLPGVIMPNGGPVVLNVGGCGILRVAAATGTPYLRVTALENG